MAGGTMHGLAKSSLIPIADVGEIDAEYCLRFPRRIRDCSFATVDAEGLPAVRVIDVMHVEDGRLYFLTPRGKEFSDSCRGVRMKGKLGKPRASRRNRIVRSRLSPALRTAVLAGPRSTRPRPPLDCCSRP